MTVFGDDADASGFALRMRGPADPTKDTRQRAADLDAKLYAAVLHVVTELEHERLDADRRAYLASQIVTEVKLRKIV